MIKKFSVLLAAFAVSVGLAAPAKANGLNPMMFVGLLQHMVPHQHPQQRRPSYVAQQQQLPPAAYLTGQTCGGSLNEGCMSPADQAYVANCVLHLPKYGERHPCRREGAIPGNGRQGEQGLHFERSTGQRQTYHREWHREVHVTGTPVVTVDEAATERANRDNIPSNWLVVK